MLKTRYANKAFMCMVATAIMAASVLTYGAVQAQAATNGSQLNLPKIGVNEKPNNELTGKFKKSEMGASGIKNIEPWKKYNSDVMGWLKIPGTNINYPVVYRKDSNLFYEKNGYNQQPTTYGAIWQDYRNTITGREDLSRNTILYGHNWDNVRNIAIGSPNDTHFGQLPSYHYKDFSAQNPYIYYSIGDDEMVWQVFATFYTDVDFNYIRTRGNDEEFQQIIDTAKARSRHDFDVKVTPKDKLLTLSTCTRVYGQRDDQRFVVMAKLLTEKEAENLKSVKVTTNKDYRQPNFKNPIPGFPKE